MSKNNIFLSSDYDSTISLLNVYLAEWSHRDQTMYTHVYKMFYSILMVILLPNFAVFLQIDLPEVPIWVFRIIGLLLSFVFLYLSLGYAVRLHSVGYTYKKIIDKLPADYRRERLENINIKQIHIGKIFKPNLTYILCFALFLILFSLSITLIIIYL